jgi:hypothetical protein
MRPRLRTLSLLGALAAGVTAGGMVPAAVAATGEEASPHAGDWAFVGGDAERQRIDAAIDEATAEMLPGIRTIARNRLKESNFATDRIEITIAGAFIKIDQVGFRAITAPASGVAIPWRTPQGDKAKVSHKLVDGVLVQRMLGSDGGRENRFSVSGDGTKVTVRTRIWSERLPADVVYQLSYRRT